MNSLQKGMVALVDENDQSIGVMGVEEAHLHPAALHRAISVFLFRGGEQGLGDGQHFELLVQKRSQSKIVGAGEWANSVCGNVMPDETYLECARRKLQHELGVVCPVEPLTKFRYQVKCNQEYGENEIDQIMVGFYDDTITPNPDEVADHAWVTWPVLDDRDWAPWFKLMLGDQKLGGMMNQKLRDKQDENN